MDRKIIRVHGQGNLVWNGNILQGDVIDVRILLQSGDTFQAENLPNVFLVRQSLTWWVGRLMWLQQ